MNVLTNRNNTDKISSTLKKMLGDKKYFVLPVGTYRQTSVWTCGPTALKIVLNYFGKDLSESYLAKLSKTTKSGGTNPSDLVKVAKQFGLYAKDKQNLTVLEVKKNIKSGNLIIANYQYTPKFGDGHYAVIIGYDKNKFILSDPANDSGYVIVKISDFIKLWYELEDKTVRQGIIINFK